MRVLVTGGAGFIGSALTKELCERGHDVVVLDSFITGHRERIPDDVELHVADIRDQEGVSKACVGAEVVFHIAALRSVARSVDDPLLSTDCNVLGTINVLDAATRADVRRVVYASSSSVYGDSDAAIQREENLPRPISPYAVGKLAGEQYCAVWSRMYGMSTVSLRYFNVFGPGQSPESKYSCVIPAFLAALAAGRPPQIEWDGEQTRDFTYVDDVVRATLRAANADPRMDGTVINVGSGDPKSINEVLRTVSDAAGTWIEPRRTERRTGDVRNTHADIGRARELLDWRPEVPWTEAVNRTVDWFRSADHHFS